MKICILCNFGPFPEMGGSIGGSEAVIEAVAEGLIKNYDYEVDICAHNYRKSSTYKNINLFPCPKGDNIVSMIAQNDHVMVYSDSQWNFDSMVGAIEEIDCRVSVCLVGAYHLQSHPKTFNLLKKNINKFNLITHSSITSDYQWCLDNDLPVKVIPNGVDLKEFNNTTDFRQKYGIKEKYIIISVNNFFYGKGFELLPKICKKIKSKDVIILQLSNTVQYPYDLRFLQQIRQQSEGLNIKFLRDLPREDVIAAFKCSDLFLFPSKKEVAPLVILESRAAKLPWISMDVGNVREQSGGVVINNSNVDHKGYKIVDDKTINSYLVNIADILELKDVRENLIREGQQSIESLDWKNIVPLYNEVFSK